MLGRAFALFNFPTFQLSNRGSILSKSHYMALSAISGLGGVTARKLLDRFGSLPAAFAARDEELLSVPRVTAEIVAGIRQADLDGLQEDLEALEDQGVQVLTWEDDAYPTNLLDARDSPYLLYAAGELRDEDATAVAVVGSREASAKSMESAERIARELAERGVTVVSGLAEGIDTAAHTGALAADGGRTIAVLGSGLAAIHPRENIPLAEQITRRGAVVTEYAPRVTVRGPQLMARDRIVSGLSKAVIVVEARVPSGSLDTAEKARKQERPVFALPGSPGTDELISSGATPFTSPDELIARISEDRKPPAEQPSLF